jgi:hypothetical protein
MIIVLDMVIVLRNNVIVIKIISEQLVKKPPVLMIALEKEFVLKENVIVKLDLLEPLVL